MLWYWKKFSKQIKEIQLNFIELVDSAADRILDCTAMSSLSFMVCFIFHQGHKPSRRWACLRVEKIPKVGLSTTECSFFCECPTQNVIHKVWHILRLGIRDLSIAYHAGKPKRSQGDAGGREPQMWIGEFIQHRLIINQWRCMSATPSVATNSVLDTFVVTETCEVMKTFFCHSQVLLKVFKSLEVK